MRFAKARHPTLVVAAAALVSLCSSGLTTAHARDSSAKHGAEAKSPLDPTVLRVNGSRISKNQLRLMARTVLTTGGDPASAGDTYVERNRAALADLAIQEVLAEQGAREKLQKNPQVEDALTASRREILSKAYLQYYFQKHPVTDADLRTSYEYKRTHGQLLEYRAHQILVPTRADAEAILKRLHNGEKLSDLVKLTKDPGGNTDGGLVNPSNGGWFEPDIFVDPYLAEAIKNLKPGQPPQKPVRSRFGWSLLWINQPPREVKNAKPFDDLPSSVVDALRQREMQQRMNKLIKGFLAKAHIVDGQGKVVNGLDLVSDNPVTNPEYSRKGGS